MERKKRNQSLSAQMKRHVRVAKEVVEEQSWAPPKGSTEFMVRTGSTLLDLAISGSRVKFGGIPTGIIIEVFGPSGSGKTVVLSEVAGYIQHFNGSVLFFDPEARLNDQFAKLFDFDVSKIDYIQPDTVTEVFKQMRKWEPKSNKVNGVFTDSLAALSTELEMGNEDGDKMGMRRAKEFSEELRKTARIIANKNMILMASNQIRDTTNTFGPKTTTPGGKAFPFYASLRIAVDPISKITREIKLGKKTVKRVIGVRSNFKVVKSSVDIPFREAPVSIIFDYGIDDVRENLQFVKDVTGEGVYTVNDASMGNSLEKAIQKVERMELMEQLREQVNTFWLEIEKKARTKRANKKRYY